MPPFPGNEQELDALAWYIQHQQTQPEPLEGPQLKGVAIKEIKY
jgi:mono/diheme cytochrome c family protein